MKVVAAVAGRNSVKDMPSRPAVERKSYPVIIIQSSFII
jgi:hypothetical protein